MRIAVRNVLIRYNCISVIRIVNKLMTYQKVDIKRVHSWRGIHIRCTNEFRMKRVSPLVPARYLSQGVNERVPSLSEITDTTVSQLSIIGLRKKDEDRITVDYHKGLPRITVPLPSRKENCRFTLKPVSDTVGSLAAMIKEEDRGIDRVTVSSIDGVKIASTCSIELLLDEEEFFITINDSRSRVSVPSTLQKSFTKDDLEKLSDVRMQVSQLYETLHVNEYQVYKEKQLKIKLEQLQTSLEPLEEQRQLLEKRAEFKTSVLTWFGLGMMGVQFGILARLTWWEYSWDIMEPVTYFVTYGTAMAMYAYFAITKQDYVLPDIRDRQHLITFHKKARKSGFDVHRYNSLKEQLINVQADLDRLQEPLRPSPNGISSYTFDDSYYGATNSHMRNNWKSSSLENVREYISFLINKTKKS